MDCVEELRVSFEELTRMGIGGDERVKARVYGDWSDIPTELLLQIVSLLDDQTAIVASGVCRGWRDTICLNTTHLSLSWCSKNMNNLVLSLAPKFTKLQKLVLRQDQPQLEDRAVATVARFCSDLQSLDLSKSFRLTDNSLFAIASACQNLTSLNISGCSTLSDTGLECLVGLCTALKVLNLCGCVRAATDRSLQAIGRNCTQLQSLNLGWCDYVGDLGVVSVAQGCPDLRTLDLCGCVLITDASVVALAARCDQLWSLGLYYCQNITDMAMYSLADRTVRNRRGLRSLNISQCTALTPFAVQSVCDAFPSLHTCFGKYSLIMSGCSNLTSVHCACAVQAHRGPASLPAH